MTGAIPIKVFAVRSSESVALPIYKELLKRPPMGFKFVDDGLSIVERSVFSNRNLLMRIASSVNGAYCVVIHTQVVESVHDDAWELFGLLQALVSGFPMDILLIHPYMPYARGDKQTRSRQSVYAVLWAEIINMIGVKHVILVDPHDDHNCNNFKPFAKRISCTYLLANEVKTLFDQGMPRDQTMIVYPDGGAAKRFERFQKYLGLPFILINKEREADNDRPKVTGTDGAASTVNGWHVIMPDDEAGTFRTALEDCEVLKQHKPASINFIAPHGVINLVDDGNDLGYQPVVDSIETSGFDRVYFGDTVPIEHKTGSSSKIRIVKTAPFIAEAIHRSLDPDKSISELFEPSSMPSYL